MAGAYVVLERLFVALKLLDKAVALCFLRQQRLLVLEHGVELARQLVDLLLQLGRFLAAARAQRSASVRVQWTLLSHLLARFEIHDVLLVLVLLVLQLLLERADLVFEAHELERLVFGLGALRQLAALGRQRHALLVLRRRCARVVRIETLDLKKKKKSGTTAGGASRCEQSGAAQVGRNAGATYTKTDEAHSLRIVKFYNWVRFFGRVCLALSFFFSFVRPSRNG